MVVCARTGSMRISPGSGKWKTWRSNASWGLNARRSRSFSKSGRVKSDVCKMTASLLKGHDIFCDIFQGFINKTVIFSLSLLPRFSPSFEKTNHPTSRPAPPKARRQLPGLRLCEVRSSGVGGPGHRGDGEMGRWEGVGNSG